MYSFILAQLWYVIFHDFTGSSTMYVSWSPLSSQSQAQIPLSSKRQKHNVYRQTTPYRGIEREYPYVSTDLLEPLTHYSHIIVNSVANY